jgi:hypothetical protein
MSKIQAGTKGRDPSSTNLFGVSDTFQIFLDNRPFSQNVPQYVDLLRVYACKMRCT